MTETSGTHKRKTLSFSEIVKGRDALVQVTEDGFVFAAELVMVMTGSDRNYANQILRRLPEAYVNGSKIFERPTVGGGRATKLVSFANAIELIMVLPGETAKDTRYQFANIIQRYLGGDKSLIKEIQYNADSDKSISKMARDSLSNEGVTLQERVPRRKRDLDYDDIPIEPDEDPVIKAKKLKLLRTDMDVTNEHTEDMDRAFELQRKIMALYTEVADNDKIPASGKLQIQENILNLSSQTVVMGWNTVKMRIQLL